MSQISDQTVAELLYRALESERGIAVPATDVLMLKQQIWRVKGELGDPRLDALILVHAPVDGEVWICQRDQDL